jgi:pimeloyl-ACP methyl ester carboxylesterase
MTPPTVGTPTVADLLADLEGGVTSVERPDGTVLRVVDLGDGPDVVLLIHGFGVSTRTWSQVVPRLVAAGKRVVAYDQRAHGRSTVGGDGIGGRQLADDLRAVVEQLELTSITAVCHSMGNFVWLTAMGDDDLRRRFARGVLVNPITGHSGKGAPATAMQGPLLQLGVAQALARHRRIGSRLSRVSLGPDPAPAVVEACRVLFSEIPTAVGPCVRMLRRESVESVLPKVDVPLHVLTTTDDRTTPSWHAELIVRWSPRAQIEFLPDAGHMLVYESPDAIADVVLSDGIG